MGKPAKLEVDLVIGADGANSRVAKDMDAGEYDYAIAFQVRAGRGAAERGAVGGRESVHVAELACDRTCAGVLGGL